MLIYNNINLNKLNNKCIKYLEIEYLVQFDHIIENLHNNYLAFLF